MCFFNPTPPEVTLRNKRHNPYPYTLRNVLNILLHIFLLNSDKVKVSLIYKTYMNYLKEINFRIELLSQN